MRRRLGALCRSGCCDSIQLQGWVGQGATGVSQELKGSQHKVILWKNSTDRSFSRATVWGSIYIYIYVLEKHVERG